MPAERKRKMHLQYFYVVYGIYISLLETVQIRSIFIATNIITFLLWQ
jgi:hypothetical protein